MEDTVGQRCMDAVILADCNIPAQLMGRKPLIYKLILHRQRHPKFSNAFPVIDAKESSDYTDPDTPDCWERIKKDFGKGFTWLYFDIFNISIRKRRHFKLG